MTPQSIYDGPAWARAKHFRRSETVVNVSTVSVQLLAVNPNRMGLIISCPSFVLSAGGIGSSYATAADTTTTGVKLTHTAAGTRAETVYSASFLETAAAGVVADLEFVRSAVVTKLARFTTAGIWSGPLPMSPSDTVRWNVITAQPASTADFSIGAQQLFPAQRMTISVNGPAVDGNGIQMYQGNNPLILWRDVIGDALTEDLFAICNNGASTIGIWDIFY